MQPILASGFAGIEIMLILPALIVTTVVGLSALLFRVRVVAIICGILCGITGAFALWCAASPQPEKVRATDAMLGCVGVAVAALLLCVRRRRKDDHTVREDARSGGR